MDQLKVAEERVEGIKGAIAEVEAKIAENVGKMQKHLKKGELHMVKFYNNLIAKEFDRIEEYKQWLLDAKFEAKKLWLLKMAPGFEPVLEVLDEILQDDIKWHEELRTTYKEDRKKLEGATKITIAIAKMSPQEALELFKTDLENRFIKLVGQVEKKAGEIKEVGIRRNENFGFDGYVIGSEKTVTLSTIGAGGYNIQRAHYRTLIKEKKK